MPIPARDQPQPAADNPSDMPAPIRRIRLKTGCDQRTAIFCTTLYQLTLQGADEPERVVNLGFAGGRLLERLLQVPGDIVPREELMAYAWPERIVGQGSLNQQIYSLRQIFSDEKGREVIQTLPRRGYQFNPLFVIRTIPSSA